MVCGTLVHFWVFFSLTLCLAFAIVILPVRMLDVKKKQTQLNSKLLFFIFSIMIIQFFIVSFVLAKLSMNMD